MRHKDKKERKLATLAILKKKKKNERSRITKAGISASQCKEKARAKTVSRSSISPFARRSKPTAQNIAPDNKNGTVDDRIICRILEKISVPVVSATKSALVETGEQRSPKKAPDRTAPPISRISTPSALPIAEQITPIVAAVPNEVPVRYETAQHRINARGRNAAGRMSFAA